MARTRISALFALTCVLPAVAVAWGAPPQARAGSPPPAARKIPALNAPDQFPGACVDCHLNYKDMNLDARFSTALARWSGGVEPKLLQKAQATALPGLQPTGRHPAIPSASLKDIPRACLACHGRQSKTAPPFARMLHAIHLTGDERNPFLTLFQGECTHCHKLDMKSGVWSVPSGPEKGKP